MSAFSSHELASWIIYENLTLNFEINSFNFDRAGVDLTVVQTLILVLYVSYVEVPVFGEWSLNTKSLIVDNATIFVGQ